MFFKHELSSTPSRLLLVEKGAFLWLHGCSLFLFASKLILIIRSTPGLLQKTYISHRQVVNLHRV